MRRLVACFLLSSLVGSVLCGCGAVRIQGLWAPASRRPADLCPTSNSSWWVQAGTAVLHHSGHCDQLIAPEAG